MTARPELAAGPTPGTPPLASPRRSMKADSSEHRPHARPWRTEGLPKGEPPKGQMPWWLRAAVWTS
jgi:hypothetical protein